MKTGRKCNGIVVETTTKLPVRMPAHPSPAMARPMIKVMDVFDIPQSNDPSSKRNTATRYETLTEKIV